MGGSESPPLKRQRRNPSSTINPHDMIWRNAICDALDLDTTIADDELHDALISRVRDYEGDSHSDEELEVSETEPYYKHLYRIHCAREVFGAAQDNAYEDPPITKSTDGKDIHLSANKLITDLDLYVQRNIGISFIVVHEFICCKSSRGNRNPESNPMDPTKELGESLFVASEYLYRALLKLNTKESQSTSMPVFETGKQSLHWDFWAFHNLPILQTLPSLCDGTEKKHASVFSEYFCTTKLPHFKSIEKLASTGYFTRQSLGYLFIPGDIVVVKSPRGWEYDMCYELTKWPSYLDQWGVRGDNASTSPPTINTYIEFSLSSWQFDGNFMKVPLTNTYNITIKAKERPITCLPIVPYACLTEEKRLCLLSRGKMFWKCRKMHYVSYEGWDYERLEHFDNSRFVIDPALSKAYYRYNPERPKEPKAELTDSLGTEAMKRIEPPDDNLLLTTPTSIWGFNMQDKIWKKLAIANVKEVDWDEKAFDNLVIDPDSKDVIQALVTNKIQNSMSTDLVRGKGSGLILLLHGPPGTGKTLTAESVAEHARKPLYRVTCGDIGTKPEAVEEYLKKVLSLGKSWDCVVLLDEAEVFLQERSLIDIERNALVSVFLRNLEYYDGILILTSNRVGTFDEGFRSRIQLAVHYPKLKQTERRRVWENFVNRLKDDPIASVDVDTRNLHSNLTELSEFDLNGREIRNAINVARPLAKSEERKVDFESLKKVIKVQQKFDDYMKEVNEGLDDEKVAREEGKR
ncbi:hypothetical protein F4803DRAFT_572222 [Xylaria telfairii]|nr:hypothetical protein F4803DRAFT_572222 [Xylaria telfairii]